MNKVVKNTIWNMLGSFVYFFCLWLMTVLAPRLSGDYAEAGCLNIAMSVCNIFVMISNFSVRNYQVSDIDNSFSNGEYVSFRIITCAVSMAVLLIYLAAVHYSAYITLSVLCYMILKTVEALVDVTQGMFQKAWRLDIVNKSLIIRGIANLIVFGIMEYLFKNLVATLLATALTSLALALLFDVRPCRKMFEIKIDLKNKNLARLCLYCIPLFLHGIFSTLIAGLPRIFSQKLLGEEMLGYYASVAAPAMVVQVAAGNIFSPCIPLMSKQFKNKDRKIFKTILIILFVIFSVGALALAVFSLLGDWFLKAVFGEDILAYSYLLLPTIVVSVLTAVTWFASSVFTVIGMNNTMAVLEGAIALLVFILSPILINLNGLNGINQSLIIGYSVYFIVGGIVIVSRILRHLKLKASDE